MTASSAQSAFWRSAKPLILASASAIRRSMLEKCNIPVQIIPASIDERLIEEQHADKDAKALAAHLAQAKALAVSRLHPGRYVLGSDQILLLEGETLHKQTTQAGALVQLQHMSGKTHTLTSAASLACDGAIIWSGAATASMTMRKLQHDDILAYLEQAGVDILSSVGCYQIEGLGVHLFEKIEGDHFTILGLPLLAVLDGLRKAELL